MTSNFEVTSPKLALSEETANRGNEHKHFEERLEKALTDDNMHQALERFAPSWLTSRSNVFASEEADYGSEYSFASMRSVLRKAKDNAIEHQEELIAQFKVQAEAAGAIIYEAHTAEDANRYIYDLCRRKGIDLVVKSKTMVSEETELNPYLEARGVTPVETDLGEWVAQLAHERPSHMVMPIIHKTRQQVGNLLTEELGREISRENVAEQVAVIRVEHRKSFLNAGMGISGANALIAESGTVMMLTNEGNGRLVTSLPPVHVVMAGYDKLIGTFAETMTQLRLLARSATAQQITSYTTFITGPATPNKEMHIVLVDNGRSEMRADPHFKEALRCIRCAACANVCPSYQQVGGHAFGYIYSGAIGLVVTPFHHGLEADAGPQSLCVSCNACETVCPVEIPLPGLILDVRSRVVEANGLPWLKKVIFGIMARPRLFDITVRFFSIAQFPMTLGSKYIRTRRLGVIGKLPGVSAIANLARWRSLPAFATKPLRDRVKEQLLPSSKSTSSRVNGERSGITVCYFAGCMIDRLFPEMGEAVIIVLSACGVQVEDLQQHGWLLRARALAEKVMDFASFVEHVLLTSGMRLPVRKGDHVIVTYHDSCQSINCLGLQSEARHIIQDALGLELREMPQSDVCCGFGGATSIEHGEVSERIMNNKLNNVESTGATVLVADNPGCLMHLRGGVDASRRNVRVLHLAQLIAEHLEE